MPWPKKPPMTLKEAKRAHKTDGGGFRFTASQMVRADRQDAQEEKRQKSLEKEKTRQENKRKRDDKAERDRAVKRKMLEEGRISVEDTWGKVTASQPRLNKFFARPLAEDKITLHLPYKTVQEGDDGTDESHTGDSQPEREERARHAGNVEERGDATPVSQSSKALKEQHHASSAQSNIGVVNSKHGSANDSPRNQQGTYTTRLSPLTELRPSEANARAALVQQESGNRKSNAHYASSFPDPLKSNSYTPFQPSQPGKLANQAPSYAMAGSISSLSLPDEIPNRWAHCDNDTEEDFPDDIDDETLLLMCAGENAKGNNDDKIGSTLYRTSSKHLNSTTSNNDTVSIIPNLTPGDFSNDTEQLSPHLTYSSTTTPVPEVLNESFSTIFNEIDDCDLVALAEQVEADMQASPDISRESTHVSTQRTSATPTMQTATIQHTSASEPQAQPVKGPNSFTYTGSASTSKDPTREINSNSANPPFALTDVMPTPTTKESSASSTAKLKGEHTPSITAMTASTEMKPPRMNPRKRRVLPWDEIAAPGPSTQAAMLELLEEAEAQMKK